MPTKNSGFLVQRTSGGPRLLDLVAPRLPGATGGIAHHAWDEGAAEPAWRPAAVFGEELGEVAAVSLIQSNFGDPGNLEAVARAGDRLAAFWRGTAADARWSGPQVLASGVAGCPALIQGRSGGRGNFELVAPLAAVGLGHWYRDNDTADLAWRGPAVLGEGAGRFEAASMVESHDGSLEVVARVGDRLVLFRRAPGSAWRGPFDVVSGVAGRPALLQSRAGPRGSFELVAPLAAVGLGHWYRDHDVPAAPWRGPAVFATDLGRCDEVSLIEGAAGPPGRLEVAARAGDRVAHCVREAGLWALRASFPVVPRRAPEPPPPRPAPDRPRSSPLRPGPHHAGFRRVAGVALSEDACHPGARPCEGSLHRCPEGNVALLYYPASADGEDAPVATGGPFPAIAIAHARRLRSSEVRPGAPEDPSQDYRQLAGVMAHLARRGFVVIAPDLSWLAADDGPARRAAALRDALCHLRAGSRGPLLADFGRVGLIGHGLGGLAAAVLAADRACPFQVRALGLLAPLAPSGGAAPRAERDLPPPSAPPLLVLRGGADTGSAGAGGGPAALYALAAGPRALVTIPGANHFGFTTSLALAEPFDGAPAIARRDQQRVARAYLTALFERHLRGVAEVDPWLRGELSIDELAGLGVDVQADAARTG